MSATLLTCAETPLAWPGGISVDDLPPQKTAGIRVIAPMAGNLTISSRQARDGITVAEATGSTGADYRGQRYALDEAVFHVPGLHVFPGQTDVYPAEYHVHFTSVSTPIRALTLVIPVSHKVTGAGQDYFAALSPYTPDPAVKRPTLESLLTPGDDVLQYRGPELRGRVGGGQPDTCIADALQETQFLLVRTPCQIRAADLERIPREGTTGGAIVANDTASMPYPGPAPTSRLTRDRLLRTVVLARPGILGPALLTDSSGATPPYGPDGGQTIASVTSEYTCRPLQVVDGQDVVSDVSGGYKTLAQILGLAPLPPGEDDVPTGGVEAPPTVTAVRAIGFFMSFLVLALFRALLLLLWRWKFSGHYVDEIGGGSIVLIVLEVLVMIGIAAGAAVGGTSILNLF